MHRRGGGRVPLCAVRATHSMHAAAWGLGAAAALRVLLLKARGCPRDRWKRPTRKRRGGLARHAGPAQTSAAPAWFRGAALRARPPRPRPQAQLGAGSSGRRAHHALASLGCAPRPSAAPVAASLSRPPRAPPAKQLRPTAASCACPRAAAGAPAGGWSRATLYTSGPPLDGPAGLNWTVRSSPGRSGITCGLCGGAAQGVAG